MEKRTLFPITSISSLNESMCVYDAIWQYELGYCLANATISVLIAQNNTKYSYNRCVRLRTAQDFTISVCVFLDFLASQIITSPLDYYLRPVISMFCLVYPFVCVKRCCS